MQHARNFTHLPKSSEVQSIVLGFKAKPKLLGLIRKALRLHHYSRKTKQTYSHSVKLLIYYNGIRACDGKGLEDHITVSLEFLNAPVQNHLE